MLRMCSALVAISGTLTVMSVEGAPKELLPTQESFSQVSTRYLSVRDSIEMTRFARNWTVDSSNLASFSPDKQYFVVVTSRGVLQSNEIESTLWIFQSEQVRNFLFAHDDEKVPAPRAVARFAAVPRVDYLTSYEPIISNVRWLPDSKALLVLVKNSQKERQLYQINLSSGSVHPLTPKGFDVFQFESKGRVIAYRAAGTSESLAPAHSPNPPARDVTGLPLVSILFPEKQYRFAQYSELRVIRNAQDIALRDPATRQPIRLLNSIQVPERNPLSISPDGGKAVVLLPSREIQKSWESFEAEPTASQLKLHSSDSNAIAESNWSRPTEYALVNLKSGETKPLVNAPNGDSLGYADRSYAVWSSDGNKLLVTNTYLPLEGVDDSERKMRLRPCAAAVVDVNSGIGSCVAFSKGNLSRLLDASFGDTVDDVIIQFAHISAGLLSPTKERYHREGRRWQLSMAPSTEDDHQSSESRNGRCSMLGNSDSLSVEVRQDLNTAPALWATDCASGIRKSVWNPNPQLTSFALGEASVFHWKDESGYEWTGGLVKPPDYISGRRYPLVIQTHGFFEDEFMTDGSFTTAFAARPLASAGMVVLQIPTNYNHLGSPDEVTDQIRGFDSAIDKLTSDGLIDPKKVGIIGFSRTGYHVESALIKEPTRFAAATLADYYDPSYIQQMLFSNGDSSYESERIYNAKPYGEGLKKWMEGAPGFHIDQIETPLRIEAMGPISYLGEWETYSSLWQQGKPVDFIYIPDGQHILQKPLERIASQQGNVDWFRFWLEGEEDPDPAKAEQYSRWRELRKLQDKNKAAGDKSLAPMN